MNAASTFPAAEAAGLLPPGGEDIFVTSSGHAVRGHLWPAQGRSRGRVMFCPGFTEFVEKHSDATQQLHKAGYDLLMIDWPGQGLSGHLGRHSLTVHIDDFNTHLDAAEALMAMAGWSDQKMILIGHSMGGHLVLRLAQRLQSRISAMILLSPMISPPIQPLWLGRVIARIACMLGLGRQYAMGQAPRTLDRVRDFRPDNVLTRAAARYEENFLWFDDKPELRRSGASWGWGRAAYESCHKTTASRRWMAGIDQPVLALTAGSEIVVHRPSTDRMLAVLPHCEWHEFPDARHELCQETDAVRADLWRRINTFLADL